MERKLGYFLASGKLLTRGRMVRVSASGAADSGLTPSLVKPMTLNLVFTASLLDALH